MRAIPLLLSTGAAIAVVAGAAAMAGPDKPKPHVLTVQLPGGGVEQIRYSGDVAPQVVFEPGGVGPAAAAVGAVDPNDPFAALQRMSAEMDREMAALMRNGVSMPPPAWLGADPQRQAGFVGLPQGGESYSVVSNLAGGHVCSQSVEITSQGPGQPPKVVSHTSGDCASRSAAPAAHPQGDPGPGVI